MVSNKQGIQDSCKRNRTGVPSQFGPYSLWMSTQGISSLHLHRCHLRPPIRMAQKPRYEWLVMLEKLKQIHEEGGFTKRVVVSLVAGIFSTLTVVFYCAAAGQPDFNILMGALGTFTMITGAGLLASFLWMD